MYVCLDKPQQSICYRSCSGNLANAKKLRSPNHIRLLFIHQSALLQDFFKYFVWSTEILQRTEWQTRCILSSQSTQFSSQSVILSFIQAVLLSVSQSIHQSVSQSVQLAFSQSVQSVQKNACTQPTQWSINKHLLNI